VIGAVQERVVMPERLDHLPADDPKAERSRRDLRRVHRAMRSLSIIQHAVDSLRPTAPPRRILELGAGDGSLLLRFARSKGTAWPGVELTLLDQQDLLTDAMRAKFAAVGWEAKPLCADAIEWAQSASSQHYDLCVTTLFLHHFQTEALTSLLAAVAERAQAFVACEPRRSRASRIGGHLLWFLGVNDVTREDGITSIAAGFADQELSALWPRVPSWQVKEYFAWPFTHCFVARRLGESSADGLT
jgi:SAM-dependent methyltransferase